ncbi:RG190-like protein [Mya arenaria]|uniref:RG190-like protein n=2 Tax=Mya arenaria TaxID=6604 RepID=A0ABY7DCS7_MYAAR|nr:RG190-like protein [Mya arenaria]
MSDFETMTEFITQDYIRYKLQKTGYDFENISKWPTVYCQTCKSKLETDVFTRCYTCNDANMFTVPEDKTGDAPYERELKLIRERCDVSEDEFEKGFRLDTSNINPNKATVQITLLKEADKLFEEATQWEGIVSLLILSGSLATRCAVKGYISEAKGIQRNTSWYINDILGQWMKENGGWEGFPDWAERFNANDSGSPMQEKKQKKQHTLQTIIKTVKNKIKKDIKATGHSESSYCLTDFAMSPNNPSVPHIIEKCVDFIEAEGLNATGIHQIPGDQDQVDFLKARFEEDSNVDISTLGIEVHAVAMVLRKFFATLTEPLVPVSIYEDLIEVSCKCF